jgi:hypothetical protein
MRYDFSKRLDVQSARAYLEKLISEGCTSVTVTKKKKLHSIGQFGLFHIWVRIIAEYVGYLSPDECKRDIKRVLLGTRLVLNKFTGNEEQVDYETHLFSVEEMSGFMDKMKIWAQTELGVYLPYEGEDGYYEMLERYCNDGN